MEVGRTLGLFLVICPLALLLYTNTRGAAWQAGPRTRDDAARSASCTVRETSRRNLVVEGARLLYVEPAVVNANRRGDVLLLGTPNYLSDAAAGQGSAREPAAYGVLGAIVPRNGPPRTVRGPVEAKLISGVRAAARADGRWDVVFAEIKPWTKFPPPDTAVRLWHGVYDGSRWTSLAELPLPAAGVLHPYFSSSLAQKGDTLAWALRTTSPGGGSDVVIYERRAGVWSHEVLRTENTAYVELAYLGSLGLTAAIVQPDRTVPYDENSLFFYARQPGWQALGKIIHGGSEPVHQVSLNPAADGTWLTWWSAVREETGVRREARTMLQAPGASTMKLGNISQSIVPVMPGDGRRLWVSDHMDPRSRRRELRFLRDSAGSGTVLGRFPNPFEGRFLATALPGGELLIAGPQLDRSAGVLTTLLLRARLECRARTG